MVVAAFRERTVICLDCSDPCGVIHSLGDRRPHGLPWQGRWVTLRI